MNAAALEGDGWFRDSQPASDRHATRGALPAESTSLDGVETSGESHVTWRPVFIRNGGGREPEATPRDGSVGEGSNARKLTREILPGLRDPPRVETLKENPGAPGGPLDPETVNAGS